MWYGNYNDAPYSGGPRIIDLQRVADLGAEPITLTEAKTQLRVTFTDDDTEITALITKARKHVENYCNISIVYQRIQLTAYWGDHCWQLPYGPVIGIESVQTSENQTGSGPMLFETADTSWRIDGDDFAPGGHYRYRTTYTAGMATCPADLQDCILQVLTFLYENRGAEASVDGLKDVLLNAQNYRRLLWI